MISGLVSLLELLAQDEKAQFTIPDWRRPYVWTAGRGKWEVERLWQDLRTKCRVDKKHFCGVMLLHKLPGENVPMWEMVDGQQRLATIFLLLMALRDVCEKRGVDCTDLNALLRGARTDECRLVLRDAPASDRLALNKIFRRTAFALDPKIQEESKIYLAYCYFLSQIRREIPSGSQEFLLTVLQGIEVKIQIVEPTDDMKRNFAGLDSRGKTIKTEPPAPATAAPKKPEPAPVPVLLPDKPHPRRSFRMLRMGLLLVLVLAAVGGLVAALKWQDFTRVSTNYYQGLSSLDSVPEGLLKLPEEAHPPITDYRIESTRHQVRRVTKLDASGHPVNVPEMRHAAIAEMRYRPDGSLDSIAYLDRDNHEVVREVYRDLPDNANGGKRRGIDFIFPGQIVPTPLAPQFPLLAETAYDLDGVSAKSDLTGAIMDYAGDKRIAQIQYHNAKGESRPNSADVFAWRFEYNPAGLVSKIINLGPGGKPWLDKHGVAAVTKTYDASGNLIEEDYLDLAGHPVESREGIAKITFKYDDRGNKVEAAYFDTAGKPVFSRKGIARWTAQYDARDNVIEQSCFGLDGQPTLTRGGYATETMKYDAQGNLVEVAYQGTDGQPALTNEGCAAESLKYDDHGHVVEVSFLGLDGKPALTRNGHARETFKYDDRGNVTETAIFGLDDQPVTGNSGYARATFKYDDRGNKIEEDFFDAAAQPVLSKDGLAKKTFEYDQRGNIVRQSSFGVDGQPVLNKEGVATLEAKYDDRGRMMETTCYGIDGQLVIDNSGLARATFKYDERNNLIETACFGVDGKPVLDKGGTAMARFKYDDRDYKIEIAYFDVDGNPVLSKEGCAIQTFLYDARGNMIEGAYFGVDGKPTPGTNGFTKETLKYDEKDRIVEGACFGVEGQPIELGGVHRLVYTYDANNKIVKTTRYSMAGQVLP